jgi:hypothetical protein
MNRRDVLKSIATMPLASHVLSLFVKTSERPRAYSNSGTDLDGGWLTAWHCERGAVSDAAEVFVKARELFDKWLSDNPEMKMVRQVIMIGPPIFDKGFNTYFEFNIEATLSRSLS